MDQTSVKPLVATYKKLFVILSIITLVGIAVAVLRVPFWVVLTVGLVFMVAKSAVVYQSFKNLLVGPRMVLMFIILFLTVSFVIGLLFLPVLNHHGYIVGTEDISAGLMASEVKPEKESHGH